MLYEDWGTNGTAGDLGWQFSGNASIGTDAGTVCLLLNGSATLSGEYYYDGEGSVSVWVVLDSSSGKNKVNYVKIGEANGTDVWIAVNNVDGFFTEETRLHLYADTGAGLIEVDSQAYDSYSEVGWQEMTAQWADGSWSGTITAVTGTTLYVSYPFDEPTTLNPIIYGNNPSQPFDKLRLPYARRTILDFVGTYNDGTNVGTVNLGDDVITMGNVSQVGYIPYISQGFSSSLSVDVDDTGSAWSNLIGNLSNPSVFSGTFYARCQWNNTWYTLGQFVLDADGVNYDYGRQIASLTLKDILSRYGESTFPYDDASGLTKRGTLGNVIQAGDGMVVVKLKEQTAELREYYEGDTVWDAGGTSGERVRIGTVSGYDQYGAGTVWDDAGADEYGTFGIDGDIPSWIKAKVSGTGEIYITHSYPSKANISAYNDPSDAVQAIYDAMGLTAGTARVDWTYMNYYPLGWGKRYYAGDKIKDALNDVCASTMTSYTVDNNGEIKFYTDGPWSGSVYGTVDFNSAYNDSWTLSLIPATKQVKVNAGWDPVEQRYTADYQSQEGTFNAGQVVTIDAAWLRAGNDAEALAERVAFQRGVTRVALSFDVEGSLWNDYAPRDSYYISNVPGKIPFAGTYWRLMGKTYNRESNLTRLTWESERLNREWFRADISTCDGPDIVW